MLRSFILMLATFSVVVSASFITPCPQKLPFLAQSRAQAESRPGGAVDASPPLFWIRNTRLGSVSKGEEVVNEEPIECYVVNKEEILTEGKKPEVICTSDPEEYAWMAGIDRDRMVKTEGEEGLTECVEGASPTGKPEWKCE